MRGLERPPRATIYLPYAQKPWFSRLHLIVRAPGNPARLRSALDAHVKAIDPAVPLAEVRPMEEVVSASVARHRTTAALTVVFGALAAVLAGIGLYGLLSYAVARRNREIGVRIAMGARPSDVIGMVTREGLVLVGSGLAAGTLLSLAGGRLVEGLLFGVAPGDPVSFLGAGVFLALVAAAAAAIPGWRATRIAPVDALREE